MSETQKRNLIISGILAIVVVILLVIRLVPAVNPSGASLLKGAFKEQIRDNSIRGTLAISNKAVIHIDSSDDLSVSAATQASIAVSTKVDQFAADKDTARATGNTKVTYAGIANTTDYFTVYRDLNKTKQYVYYSGKAPEPGYLNDYEKWAVVDTKKNTVKNLPKTFRDSFIQMKEISYKKNKDKSCIVTGKFTDRNARGLIAYLTQTDTKNTCLMNGLSFKKDTTSHAVLKFNKDKELTSADIVIKNARAGKQLDIKVLSLKFTFAENKENISVPKVLKNEVLDTDFSISTPEERITYSLPEQARKRVKIPSFEDLNITFDGNDADSLGRLKDLILADDKVTPLSSADEDKEMVTTTLKSDKDAGFYFYTDAGDLTQIAFDGSYAMHTIPVKINGLGFGSDKATVSTILGVPSQVTTDNNITTYTYIIGDNDYELTLTFYQKDDMVNGGLQRISIIKKK